MLRFLALKLIINGAVYAADYNNSFDCFISQILIMVEGNLQQNIESQLERLLSQLNDIEEVQDSGELTQEELQ